MNRNLSLSMKVSRNAAIIELSFAGMLWGFGFIAAMWALRSMGPLSVTGIRFLIAAAVGFPIAFMIPTLRRSLTLEQFRLAWLPGLLLSLTLVLQTWGLQYTTATKSGFLTTLYVLMVPILERVMMKKRLPRFHFVFVLLGLLGVALICDVQGAWTGATHAQNADELARLRWNFGDFLTILTAIAASFHILCFGYIQNKIGSSFSFNLHQCLWAGALPLVLSFFFEVWPPGSDGQSPLVGESLIGLLMLAFGSTLIAFALQVRAQKNISPSLASLLFLLESPFAALFAVYFLNETLRTEQWLGAGLILISIAASVVFMKEKEAT